MAKRRSASEEEAVTSERTIGKGFTPSPRPFEDEEEEEEDEEDEEGATEPLRANAPAPPSSRPSPPGGRNEGCTPWMELEVTSESLPEYKSAGAVRAGRSIVTEVGRKNGGSSSGERKRMRVCVWYSRTSRERACWNRELTYSLRSVKHFSICVKVLRS